MENSNKTFLEMTKEFADIYEELSAAYDRMEETGSVSQEDLDEIDILEKQLEVIRPQWNRYINQK